jgi:hypothetical protein
MEFTFCFSLLNSHRAICSQGSCYTGTPKVYFYFFGGSLICFVQYNFNVQPRDRAVTRVCFIDCPGDSMACAADWLVLTLNATCTILARPLDGDYKV